MCTVSLKLPVNNVNQQNKKTFVLDSICSLEYRLWSLYTYMYIPGMLFCHFRKILSQAAYSQNKPDRVYY